jgi:hypothetical protein
MPSFVDIQGLDKAAVLAALFNASSCTGSRFKQTGNGPEIMSIDDARAFIQQQANVYSSGLEFLEVFGRPIMVNLSNDNFVPWLYDRENGEAGLAEQVVSQLREPEQATDGSQATMMEADKQPQLR